MLAIPESDQLEFSGIPEAARQEVRFWLRIATRVLTAPKGRRNRILDNCAAQIGIPAKTIDGRIRRYESLGWRALYDKAKHKEEKQQILPLAFLEFWKSLLQKRQRKTSVAAARRELIRMWQRGEHIPGYAIRPEPDPETGVPTGWSLPNLRRHKLTVYEAKAVQIGRSAAMELLPSVLTTRYGYLPGQVIMFDDQDYDVDTAFVGRSRKLVRPSGFNALDFVCAYDALQGYKPTLARLDGTKERLCQADFEFFVGLFLTTIGYRKDTGSIFIGEAGTTKVGKEFAHRVSLATNGKVIFKHGGVHSAAAHAGLFKGQPRGNPRYKTHRESWFRLLREEMSALPGPTGKDWRHAPEGQYQLQQYTRMLLDAAVALPPSVGAALKYPVMLWHEFVEAALTITAQINHRREHELEGWEQLGFIAREWRMSANMPWLPVSQYEALEAPQKSVVDALIKLDPVQLWQVRKLSPAEAWDMHKDQLTKISGGQLITLLGAEKAKRERVEADLDFLIEDMELHPEPIVYSGTLTNGRVLERGRYYQVFLNPFCPDSLEVCDDDLRWIGTSQRRWRDGKLDEEALRRQWNEIRRLESRQLSPIAQRGAAITREAIDRSKTNLAIAQGRPVTPEQKEAAKAQRSAVRFGQALISDPQSAIPDPQLEDPAQEPSTTESW